MRGAGHTNYRPDGAKKQAWLEEIESRPEITTEQLLGLFSPEFIAQIDAEQRIRFGDGVEKLIGLTALKDLSKDEQRLMSLAMRNMATYDEDIEDLMYEDELLAKMTEPKVREQFKINEEFSAAMRMRRTVVVHYLAQVQAIEHADGDNGWRDAG